MQDRQALRGRRPARQSRPGEEGDEQAPGDGIALQSAIGNRAVTSVLSTARVARAPDTAVLTAVGSPTTPGGAVPVAPAVNDGTSFNPEAIVHDLRRAIDQSEATLAGMVEVGDTGLKTYKFHRKVDFDAVVKALDNLSSSQIGTIRRLYLEQESTTLDNDLFDNGQSSTPSSLTQRQREHLRVLFRGTTGDAIAPGVPEYLKAFPSEIAARLHTALGNSTLAPDALNRLDRASFEIAKILDSEKLDSDQIEKLMTLHRRPVEEISLIDVFYESHTMSNLPTELNNKLPGLQANRMLALRSGDKSLADATAIEAKRRAIAVMDEMRSENETLIKAASVANPGYVKGLDSTRQKLVDDIDAIVELNRNEAMEEAKGTSTSASQAVAERMRDVLGKGRDEQGRNIGDLLKGTIGSAKAAEFTAVLNGQLIESLAQRLAETESRKATKADQIVGVLHELRSQAEHDVVSEAADPWLSLQEKKELLDHQEEHVGAKANVYVKELQRVYESVRGKGRPWDAIVSDFKSVDEDEVKRLAAGGGALSDVEELDLAIRRDKTDQAIAILRRQPHRQAVDLLAVQYYLLSGKSLQEALLGRATLDDRAASVPEAVLPRSTALPLVIGGIASGREAALVGEQLLKPDAKDAGHGTVGEMEWVAASAQLEFEATWANRGVTGRLREVGDDPETENIMRESLAQVKALREQWLKTENAQERRRILADMKRWRAALSGDLKAYEEDNKKMLDKIRTAVSIAVQIALAVALPGAGATFMSFVRITAMNIASSVASNVVIYGEDYSLDQLRGDIIGGVLGAAGGKLGEEMVGAALAAREAKAVASEVADAIAKPVAEATATAATKAGIATTVAKEAASWVGSTGLTTLGTGENGFTWENLLQGQFVSLMGKAGKKAFGLDKPAGGHGGHDEEHGATKQQEGENAKPQEGETAAVRPDETTAPKDGDPAKPHDEHFGATPVDPSSVIVGGRGGDGGRKPPGPVDPAGHGIPKESQTGLQQVADQFDVVIKVRPVNLDSVPHLQKGTLAKPEIIKSKTINTLDQHIGGPKAKEGLVGFFEPHPPDPNLAPKALHDAAMERYRQRLEDYTSHRSEYERHQAEGTLRMNNGVLELFDPRSTGKESFVPVAGDLDVFDIVHSDGSPLTDAQRTAVINQLRFMGLGVEHGAHEWWKSQSPGTYDPAIDAAIRSEHLDKNPLIAFAPKVVPQTAWADTSVRGAPRTEGVGDRHLPLSNTGEVSPAPGGSGPDGPDGAGRTPPEGHGPLPPPGTPGSVPQQPPTAFSDLPTGHLASKDFVSSEPLTGGHSGDGGRILVDGNGRKYVFKPAHGEDHLGYGGAAETIHEGERYRRAGAAAIVADELGIRTPDATTVTLDGEIGSLQQWVEGQSLAKQQMTQKQYDAIRDTLPFRDLAVYDYVIANMDRNRGNVITQDGQAKPVAIDNDFSFPATEQRFGQPRKWRREQERQAKLAGESAKPEPPPEGAPVERPGNATVTSEPVVRKDVKEPALSEWQQKLPSTVSKDMADRLRTMAGDEAALRKRLEPYLEPAEIDGAFDRLKKIVWLMDNRGYPHVVTQ